MTKKRGKQAAANGDGEIETPPPSDPAFTGLRFEESLERLEILVQELESGELPLEETIERFEEGQRLLKTCTDLLSQAELRVKEILKRADGFEERDWEAGEEDDEDAS